MADKISKQKRSEIMSAVKSKETSLEKKLRRALSKQGLKYRKNVCYLIGKPDIAVAGKKFVIFVDSCFWHGCKKHFRMPKSNINYWKTKIERNKKRDKEVNKAYRQMGWTILRFWEHNLKNPDKAVKNMIKNYENLFDKRML